MTQTIPRSREARILWAERVENLPKLKYEEVSVRGTKLVLPRLKSSKNGFK